MTQGLQFSVLFSSTDNMLSIDATAANLSQMSPELQQRAERFRQVLASEQADGVVRQDFAAAAKEAELTRHQPATVVVPGKEHQADNAAATESTQAERLPGEFDEPSDSTADAAGELLGLIQRANLTSSQIQKKAAAAAEQHQLIPSLPLDKAEPVEDELSVIAEPVAAMVTDKDLTANARHEEKSHTELKVVTSLLPEQTITPVPDSVVTTDKEVTATAVSSESKAQGATKLQTAPVTLVDTQVPEDGLTPIPGAMLRDAIAVSGAQAQKVGIEQKQTEQKTSRPEANGAKANDTEQSAPILTKDPTAAQSALMPTLESEAPVAETVSKAQLSQNAPLGTRAEVTPEQQQRQAPLAVFNQKATADVAEVNTTEQQPVAKQPVGNTQSLSQNEKMTPTIAEIGEMNQLEAASRETEAIVTPTPTDQQAQLTFASTKSAAADRELVSRENIIKITAVDSNLTTEALPVTQAAVQSEAVARSAVAATDAGANLESKSSRQAKEQGSDSTTSVDALKIDTNTKSSSNERGAEQGTEQRLFQPTRLEVTLASGASGQSSTQGESFQQQLARLDSAVASAAAAQRGAEKTPVPELSARLKQLNLQQQDAAGQLRERVQLMVRQNIQVAEIRLDPAELGQMQIRINLQQEQASVQFIVQQQQAKELLEQQMPRLREMLQQQGIQLGEGQVQQQSRQQQGDGSQRQAQTTNHPAESFSDDLPAASTVEVQHRERLVDYYA